MGVANKNKPEKSLRNDLHRTPSETIGNLTKYDNSSKLPLEFIKHYFNGMVPHKSLGFNLVPFLSPLLLLLAFVVELPIEINQRFSNGEESWLLSHSLLP